MELRLFDKKCGIGVAGGLLGLPGVREKVKRDVKFIG